MLSATRLSQPVQDAPGPVTVITREMIEASGAVNVADLMRLVPGFQVTYANGHQPVVTSHGLSNDYPRRMLVMIDNRSVYTSLLSTVDWVTLPVEIDDIDRIEVFRGPNAPAYGANAFLGVINIITRLPFQDQGFFIKAIGGALDTRYGMLRYAENEGKWRQRVSMSYETNSGFPVKPATVVNNHDDTSVGKFSYRSEYNPNSSDVIEFHLGFANADLGAGKIGSIGDPIREYDQVTHDEMVKWEHTISTTDSVSVQLYHNYTNKDDPIPIGPLFSGSPSIIDQIYGSGVGALLQAASGQPDQTITHSYFDATSERYDLEAQHIKQISNDLRLVWGGSLRLDRYQSLRWSGTDAFHENFSKRLFANAEWSVSKDTKINAGIMGENNEDVGTEYSYRLAANYQLTNDQTLRGSITHGVRTMSLFEKNLFFASFFNDGTVIDVLADYNPNVSEEIDHYELGYLLQFPKQNVSMDLSLFKQDLSNLITEYRNSNYPAYPTPGAVDFIPGASQSSNDAWASIHGLELQLRWQPQQSTLLALNYAYASLHGQALNNVSPLQYVYFDNNTPKHTASLLATHTFANKFSASLGYYYMSNMEWSGLGEDIPTYRRVDLNLAKAFKLADSDAKVELTVQNLGSDYYEFEVHPNYANTFETRAYLKFSLQM